MSCNLIQLLNADGFQPVSMPPTDVAPPELYSFTQGRLLRVGPLKGYLPDDIQIPTNETGQLANIQGSEGKSKNFSAAARFLTSVFRPLHLSGAPSLNASWAGTGDLSFKFEGVTFQQTQPVTIAKLVQKLRTDLIPQKFIANGTLHVAYCYAYAAQLEMRRSDNKNFDGDIQGINVDGIANVGARATTKIENGNALIFTANPGHPIAFAYKSSKLRYSGGRFEFFPGDVNYITGTAHDYLPLGASILEVEDSAS